MYKLSFYVPEAHCEFVKQALFAVGAGQIGQYDNCCWQTLGQGQFRPRSGSTPFIGRADELSTVSEYKVEMICSDEVLAEVISALRQAHPYEAPAFDVIQMVDVT